MINKVKENRLLTVADLQRDKQLNNNDICTRKIQRILKSEALNSSMPQKVLDTEPREWIEEIIFFKRLQLVIDYDKESCRY